MERQQELFLAIKKDNVKEFEEIMTKNPEFLTLSFGRFPILSLCYLYNSRKIISRHKKSLLALNKFIEVDEPYEAYVDFRKVAGKSLKLYLGGKTVTPTEMLSILGEAEELSNVYPYASQDKTATANINRIFTTQHYLRVLQEGQGISIEARMHNRTKILYSVLIASLCVMLILVSAVWGVVGEFAWAGTEKNPIVISSESQLRIALAQEKFYKLKNDITISKEWEIVDFKGTLDGDGHTIFVSEFVGGILKQNSGFIKNLQIVYENKINISMTENIGLFAKENSGRIENITLSAEVVANEGVDADVYFAGITASNSGVLDGCNVNIGGTFSGDGVGNGYVGGVAGLNSGTVSNCASEGVLWGETFDIGGVVNNNSGVVDNAVNYSNIYQKTSVDGWNLNVGGVVCINTGTISNSINNGALKAENFSESNAIQTYIGGICAHNTKLISHSKNNGNINATAKQSGEGLNVLLYVGGIAGVNDSVNSSAENCGAFGELSAHAYDGDNNIVFVGGIAGYIGGKVENCFTGVSLVTNKTTQLAFLGGIGGVIKYEYFSANRLIINNYYVETVGLKYGIPSIMIENSININEENLTTFNQGNTAVANLEQLKKLGVYW